MSEPTRAPACVPTCVPTFVLVWRPEVWVQFGPGSGPQALRLHMAAVVLGAQGEAGAAGTSGVLAAAPAGVDYVAAVDAAWAD